MFGNKNSENKINLNQEKDYKIEDVPIYSMRNDLQNIGSAEYKDEAGAVRIQPIPQEVAQVTYEKRKNSPFLSQNFTPGKEAALTEIKKDTNWQKLILISIFIFFLLACGAGGYYFWITRQASQNQNVSQTPAVPQQETLALSIEKPNYLPVDIENLDNEKIKETIGKYVDKVSVSGALTPVEFIVTDKNNNSIGFEAFASKIGINLLPDLFSSLNPENKFSLFIYNDSGKTRLGLAIDSKDDYKLKTALLQEESNFPKDMEPLLQNISYDSTGKIFSSGSYANTEIRYINLTNQNDLSVDYAIFGNKLVIGTTKMTIQSIMDYINNHSEVKGAQNVINDTTTGE